MEFANQFDNEMQDVLKQFDDIRNQMQLNTMFSELVVSNMTLFYESFKSLDIDSFDEDTLSLIETQLNNNKFKYKDLTLSGVGPTRPSQFKNARILKIKLEDDATRCCLIFRNGGIQIKGLRSAVEGVIISNMLFEALHDRPDATLQSSVHLINSKIIVKNSQINLDILHQSLLEDNRVATLNREQHSAVKLTINYKNEKNITALFFRKGTIIITGASAPLQLLSSYAFVVNFLAKRGTSFLIAQKLDNEVINAPKRRGRKRKHENEAKYEGLDI